MSANYKIALAALAGFLLGAWLFHTRTHSATEQLQLQLGDAGKSTEHQVKVQRVINGSNMLAGFGAWEIAGFSCVQVQGTAECYVLTK